MRSWSNFEIQSAFKSFHRDADRHYKTGTSNRLLLAQILREYFPKDATKLLRDAIAFCASSENMQASPDAVSKMRQGQRRSKYYTCLHFYFHCTNAHKHLANKLDVAAFGNEIDLFGDYFIRIQKSNPIVSIATASSTWLVKDQRLQQFFRVAVPEKHVQDLIEIAHDVVNENIELAPNDKRETIVQRAIDEGIVESDTATAWLRAGLLCAIQPSENADFRGEGSQHFARLYKQDWKIDPDWIGALPTTFFSIRDTK